MKISLDQLEALAQAVRRSFPGPWQPVEDGDGYAVNAGGGRHLVTTGPCVDSLDAARGAEAVRYLAALSPDVVLALIEEIRRLRQGPPWEFVREVSRLTADEDACGACWHYKTLADRILSAKLRG